MKKLLMYIWAELSGGELIWLKDHDNEVTLSIARQDPWGIMTAKRYWPLNMRTVVLLPDGTIDNGSYVRFWKSASKKVSQPNKV